MTVVDYAWTHPASLDAYTGVMRYISHDGSKDLSPAERDWVRSQGKTIGLVFEATANRAAQGAAAGQQDAVYANQRADALGYPKDCTLWYAVDFDGSAAQCQPYFDGIASAGGRPHAPYGGFKVVDGLRYPALGWQTVAWSGGRVSARAGLLQDHFSGSFDENRVLVPNYGAWGATAPPPPTSSTSDDFDFEENNMIVLPGQRVFVCVPPADGGGAGWKAVWGSLGVDNFGNDAGTPVRVMVKHRGGDANTNWSPPAGTDADHGGDAIAHLASGRSFGWQFADGDEGVSLWNQGSEPITFLCETAPRA